MKRRLSDVVYHQMATDAKARGTGPGGHMGAAAGSGAAGLHPVPALRRSHFPGPPPPSLRPPPGQRLDAEGSHERKSVRPAGWSFAAAPPTMCASTAPASNASTTPSSATLSSPTKALACPPIPAGTCSPSPLRPVARPTTGCAFWPAGPPPSNTRTPPVPLPIRILPRTPETKERASGREIGRGLGASRGANPASHCLALLASDRLSLCSACSMALRRLQADAGCPW